MWPIVFIILGTIIFLFILSLFWVVFICETISKYILNWSRSIYIAKTAVETVQGERSLQKMKSDCGNIKQ